MEQKKSPAFIIAACKNSVITLSIIITSDLTEGGVPSTSAVGD